MLSQMSELTLWLSNLLTYACTILLLHIHPILKTSYFQILAITNGAAIKMRVVKYLQDLIDASNLEANITSIFRG